MNLVRFSLEMFYGSPIYMKSNHLPFTSNPFTLLICSASENVIKASILCPLKTLENQRFLMFPGVLNRSLQWDISNWLEKKLNQVYKSRGSSALAIELYWTVPKQDITCFTHLDLFLFQNSKLKVHSITLALEDSHV